MQVMFHMPQAAASLCWAVLSPWDAGEWDGTGSVERGKAECICGLETGPSSTMVLLEVLVWREKNVLSVQHSDWAQPAQLRERKVQLIKSDFLL